MNLRTTHTVVKLPVPPDVFTYIASKLREAGYDHVFIDDDSVDMTGIAIVRETIYD